MTDKTWVITCECRWCNGEGYTTSNNPSEREETCIDCHGEGLEVFCEEDWRYEDEQGVKEDYQNIITVTLVDNTWGSPTLSME